MLFFNIDAHISIIEDVQDIYKELGHSIDQLSLSDHTWVNGQKKINEPLLGKGNWKKIDQKLCDKFYKKYKNQLERYDGFIVSYPPALGLLFEQFQKPIIIISCTRPDFPVFPNNYHWYIEKLKELHQCGQLIFVANNKLDKMYMEQITGIQNTHIPSICNYMKGKYSGDFGNYVAWTRSRISSVLPPIIDKHFSISAPYDRDLVHRFKGIVHFPYNLSIMSAFEQYSQSIPMFFPTIDFQKRLISDRDDMLSEILFEPTALTFTEEYIQLADWYDLDNFRGVEYFHSIEDLDFKLNNTNLNESSEVMRDYNETRKDSVYSKWSAILDQLR
jgi:hypothetical protein